MSYVGVALVAGNLWFSFANFNIYRQKGRKVNLLVSIICISGAAVATGLVSGS